LTTTLTFGPIAPNGEVTIKLIYDHRVLDGAYVARRLRDIENMLNTEILQELRLGLPYPLPADLAAEPMPRTLLKPHPPHHAVSHDLEEGIILPLSRRARS
jgi:hypothetical protein